MKTLIYQRKTLESLRILDRFLKQPKLINAEFPLLFRHNIGIYFQPSITKMTYQQLNMTFRLANCKLHIYQPEFLRNCNSNKNDNRKYTCYILFFTKKNPKKTPTTTSQAMSFFTPERLKKSI